MELGKEDVAVVKTAMEEIMNAITHGIGAIFAIIGLSILTAAAYINGGAWHMASGIIFGVSMVLLYLASTLYHSFTNQRIKDILKIFDHAAIYLLIAGTYTPFTLIPLHGTVGWIIFGIVWGLAFLGILLKIFFVKRFKVLSTLCYLLMGWFAVVMIDPLLSSIHIYGLYWLIAGGLFYTVGAIFYLLQRLPYHHAIWHLFVIAGSVAHFIVILNYVLPIPVRG